jgi:two-component system, cell cycle sensor histidine kinase and response regulator CckA
MINLRPKSSWRIASLRIALPVGLTVLLFVLALYFLALPALRESMMRGKQEMLRELTNTAWGLLDEYEERVRTGELTIEEAQVRVVARVRELRYGPEGKDYFWINDLEPRMVMHPYRTDLEGENIAGFVDPNGKHLFVEFVDVVGDRGSGYVDYMWQWKDDPDNIVPKLSFVKGFEPWGWVVGTGIYVDDVRAEIEAITRRLNQALAGILILVFLLSFYIVWNAVQTERDRARAEEQLRQREEDLSITLDSIGDGVIATDRRGRIANLNPVAETLTGWKVEEARGRPFAEVVCLFDRTTKEPVEGFLERVLREEVSDDLAFGCRLTSHDGEERTVAETGAVIRDRDGAVVGAVLVFRDVTEEIALQERLCQSERMNAIGQLSGGIAHDFNNLLTGIIGHAEFLRIELEGKGDMEAMAEEIIGASQRAADLTHQLLAFSRRRKFRTVTVDLHDIVAEVVRLLSRTIDKRIVVSQHLPASPSTVKGDPTQLQNAILNLTVNARDAMPEGGELRFDTRIAQLDEEYCERQAVRIEPGEYLELSVSDTGSGVPPEIREKIFEPFFTTKGQGEGTGLGLAGVHGCVRNHQGIVSLYSEMGVGTVFKVLLPLDREGDAVVPVQSLLPPVSGEGNILIVDDERTVRDYAARTLRMLGYEVTVCVDGVEGLREFEERYDQFDLVILDMIMPRQGGAETFRKMRAIDPEARILISSGFSANDSTTALIGAGAVGFLSKPYIVSELSREVARGLGRDLELILE